LLQRFFFRPGINVSRSAYCWNTLAGISSALESVLFSIIVTRLIGLADAGIITLGFAIGNLLATIGKYGVRTFQVTDVNCRYSFSAYFYTRIITVTAMIVCGAGYLLFCSVQKGYTAYKTTVLLLICAKFIVETFEDVFAGECQKKGRLDVASKMFISRSFSFIAVFAITILITRNVILSAATTLAGIVIVEALCLKTIRSNMDFTIVRTGKADIRELLIKCAPLFLSTFCFFYMTNAPKYAIDTVMNDEVQACYGFIAFPVFAIELLNNFIYQPTLVTLAGDWVSGRTEKVRKRLHRQILIVSGLTVLALTGAWFFGVPILSAVFGTDLTGYKNEMMILVLTGGLLAMIGYFTTVLITMRESRAIMIAYLADSAVSLALYTPVIRAYGIMGGVLLYCGLCFVFAVYEYIWIMIRSGKSAAGKQGAGERTHED